MKLLTRTNIWFIAVTLIVFSLGGKVFYERVRSLNKADAKERLGEEKQTVMDYVNTHHAVPHNAVELGGLITYSPANKNDEKDKHSHVKLYNPSEKEYEPYETLTFTINTGTQYYRATIYRSLMETNDLETAIAEAIIIIGGCLLVIILLVNFIISRVLWQPFYRTLEKIKEYDLAKENSISFDVTHIAEFRTLNNVLESMTKKMSADYRNLKEFTENASHELQTPLAVIQSKLELLIQSENLDAEQLKSVQAVYESAAKLAKMNQALLLLAKIENRQFPEIKEVALHELVAYKLELLQEWIEHKKLSVEKKLSPVYIKANPMLADILITNLVGNAIKHNTEGGKLSVELKGKQMFISNSGAPVKGSATDLFTRFKKTDQTSDSLGLGLAIVKEICNEYNYGITYEYSEGTHRITVDF